MLENSENTLVPAKVLLCSSGLQRVSTENLNSGVRTQCLVLFPAPDLSVQLEKKNVLTPGTTGSQR